jgi:hypothetical protein
MNSRRFLTLCFAVALLGTVFPPPPARAWGPEGHAIIAQLALTRLTPAAKAELRAILGEDYEIGDYEIASWPDIVRGNKAYDELYPGQGRWHYIDFDVQLWYDDSFSLSLPDTGDDVVSQIYRWRDDLAEPGKLEGEARLDGLRFLVHLVGDLHQPLHCAYRYGDMGGNMLPVRSFSGQNYAFDETTPMEWGYPSLHSVWDEAFVHEILGRRTVRGLVRILAREITPEDAAAWTRGTDVLRWAADSYWIARKQAYRWTDGAKVPFTWSRPGMELTRENYIDSHVGIVREQLKKGGVRLGELLNQALDPAQRQPRFVPPSLPVDPDPEDAAPPAEPSPEDASPAP